MARCVLTANSTSEIVRMPNSAPGDDLTELHFASARGRCYLTAVGSSHSPPRRPVTGWFTRCFNQQPWRDSYVTGESTSTAMVKNVKTSGRSWWRDISTAFFNMLQPCPFIDSCPLHSFSDIPSIETVADVSADRPGGLGSKIDHPKHDHLSTSHLLEPVISGCQPNVTKIVIIIPYKSMHIIPEMASLIDFFCQWDLKSWLGILLENHRSRSPGLASVVQDPFLTNVAFPGKTKLQ